MACKLQDIHWDIKPVRNQLLQKPVDGFCMGVLINGHDSGTDWLEVPIPYILRPIFEAHVREYPRKLGPTIWY